LVGQRKVNGIEIEREAAIEHIPEREVSTKMRRT
jgi:hypothetical protein